MKRPEAVGAGTGPSKMPQTLRGRIGAVTKPTEHGGWGLTLEPILLGMLVAPTWAGALLALAVFIAFLARQPAKTVAIDRRRGLNNQRTILSLRVAIAYALIAAALFALAWWIAGGSSFLLPFLLALPFGLVFAYYDMTRPGRTLQAELSGPVAVAAVAASIAMLGGWSLWLAWPLWIVLVARALPAVLYVRTRIRLDHGRPVNTLMPTVWHLLALAVVIALAWVDLLPWTAVLAMVMLLGRCIIMLLPQRPRVAIKTLGFSEMGLGILTVFLVAVGYWLQ
jgi:hypothetical protein